MNTDASAHTTTAEGWDKFWQGSKDAAYSAAGLHHPVIAAFWNKYFARVTGMYEAPRILDIASGSGAVVDRMFYAFGDAEPPITCVDVSNAAVERLAEKYRNVTGIAADAENIPLPDGQFDVATSQFGIEYAGKGAIGEACRLVSNDGHIAFVVHHRDGSIYKDCVNNLAAVEHTQEANFIPLAIDLFETGFRAVAGGDRAPYDAAGSALAPAVEKVNSVFDEFGTDAADGTIVKLYKDTDQIHSNMQHYQPEEVISWLKHSAVELDAYAARMRSMRDAAMDEVAFEELCNELRKYGFEIELSLALAVAANQAPLAWALIANRGPAVMGEVLKEAEAERDKIDAWIQQQVATAVDTVYATNSYNSPVLEARVVWSVPIEIAICQVRELGSDDHYHWTITGDCPSDAIPFQAAESPVAAARHFALKWQLEAARTGDEQLAATAESLFERLAAESA